MARTLNKLSPRTAQTLKKPGRHSDGGGLYLSIDEQGRRRWVFMYVRNGKRTELGLGAGRDITLASARDEASELRSLLSKGEDPKAHRNKAGPATATFGECADDYIEAMSHSWRNAKHAAQWKMTLEKYAAPIRSKDVAAIDTADVLVVLKDRWLKTPETAERFRGRIESVLDAAKAKGLRSGENPARWRGHLDQLLPKRKRLTRGHHSALPYDQISGFMTELQGRPGTAALALEFAILTAARTSEVLDAQWQEIDLEKALWTIPAARMKAGREHRVPLSRRAVAILNALKADGAKEAKGTVFQGRAREAGGLSGMAMLMLLRRMKRPQITTHGFRSTFRDWAAEATHFPSEVAEMALAHTVGDKVEAAYRRGDLFEKRRLMMEAWATYCEPRKSNVVTLTRSPA